MSRYPRAARDAKIKCMTCNAPVTETVDGGYACVACGRNPIGDRSSSDSGTTLDEAAPGETSLGDASTEETTLEEASPEEASPEETSLKETSLD